MTGSAGPLILTAELPPELHRYYTRLRSEHYPPERNHLEAHVTLFHALPPMVENELVRLLSRLSGEMPPPAGRVEGVMSLGQGTAIRLSSPPLLDLRRVISDHFHGMLTMQDSAELRLHVTVQNKVKTSEARLLQTMLATTIPPQTFAFPALALHRYRGGPWDFLKRWPFRGK